MLSGDPSPPIYATSWALNSLRAYASCSGEAGAGASAGAAEATGASIFLASVLAGTA